MRIYLIAGPPGIGKSTNAKEVIPFGVPIVDQDLAAYQYKRRGFNNYLDIASITSNTLIRSYLFEDQDFALELNLGFPSHYSYLRSILAINANHHLQLILFYTDDINVCLDRAKIRHLNGGHEVTAETITEMYASIMPLFDQNKALFHDVRLVNVSYDALAEITCDTEIPPLWTISNDLLKYLIPSKNS